jgi:hypothetical protein
MAVTQIVSLTGFKTIPSVLRAAVTTVKTGWSNANFYHCIRFFCFLYSASLPLELKMALRDFLADKVAGVDITLPFEVVFFNSTEVDLFEIGVWATAD